MNPPNPVSVPAGDANRRNLAVARSVSAEFRKAGFDPIIVGGSAVEFYTDGQYVSGDIDICFPGRPPSPRDREVAMSRLGRSLGVRRWEIDGVVVDVFGEIETSARTPFQNVGDLRLIQIEDLIAERLLIAVYPALDDERYAVARMLAGLVMAGEIEADIDELKRVAESPDYRVAAELETLMVELATARDKGGG